MESSSNKGRMNLESIIQREVYQEEKNKHINAYTSESSQDATDAPIGRGRQMDERRE